MDAQTLKDAQTLEEARTIRLNGLLAAYKAYENWDSDSMVPEVRRIQERYGVSYVEANDIVFDAIWLARQVLLSED